MQNITNSPPRQRLKLYRGNDEAFFLPLTREGEPLSEGERAAYESCTFETQFRTRPDGGTLLATATYIGFVTIFNPDLDQDEEGPLLRLSGVQADQLRTVCYADLFAVDSLGNRRALLKFDVSAEGRVTR